MHAEKLSNLIQLLGASRLKQLNSSVTHAIVGQEDQEEMKKLLKFRSKYVHTYSVSGILLIVHVING